MRRKSSYWTKTIQNLLIAHCSSLLQTVFSANRKRTVSAYRRRTKKQHLPFLLDKNRQKQIIMSYKSAPVTVTAKNSIIDCMKFRLITLFLVIYLLSGCSSSPKVNVIDSRDLMTLDQTLTGATAEISSKVRGKTEVVIARIDTSIINLADFLTDELSTHLVSSGSFIVLERGNALNAVESEHQFQMSGMVSDASAVGIGHYLGAKVVITGTFSRYSGFNQIRLRAVDVRTSQLLALYSARIKPDDAIIAGVTGVADNSNAPVVTENALAHLNRGKDLYAEGKYDDAIREFTAALNINANLEEAYSNRGLAFVIKGDLNRAVTDFSQAISINPNFYSAYINRGNSYNRLGDPDKAISDYNQAIRLNPNEAGTYINRGNAYYKKNDIARAIEDFNLTIRLSPNWAGAYSNRGAVYLNTGDFDRAIADFNQAIILDPNDNLAFYNRGLYYEKKGDYTKAIADYTQAILLNPNDADSFFRRGNLHYNKGDLDRAIADCTQAILLNPNSANYYFGRGYVYIQQKKYTQARSDINKALQLDPNNSDAKRYDAELRKIEQQQPQKATTSAAQSQNLQTLRASAVAAYNERGDYNDAINLFTQVIQLEPEAGNYFGRGMSYYVIQDSDRAIADFTQTIRLDPNFTDAYKYRGVVYYYYKKDYERAIADLTQALKLNPNSAESYNWRGWAYLEKKDYNRAIADYTQAIKLDPNSESPYCGRADAYIKMKKKENYTQARADVNRALQLDPNCKDSKANSDELKRLGY